MIKKYKNYEKEMKNVWIIVLWNTGILNNVNVFHLFCSFQPNVAQELKDLVIYLPGFSLIGG